MANYFKKGFLLTLLVLAGTAMAYGQESPQLVFDQANVEMKSGNYNEAISLYKRLEAQQTVSGALFLNLGVAYQRIDSLGKAKYYFLKSSRFNETREKGEQALENIERQFSRQSAILPQLPWDRATNWLQHQVGATVLLAAGIFLLNLGIIIFVTGWFIREYSKYLKMGGIVLGSVAVLLVAVSFYTQYVADRYSTAVMVTEKVSVREHPREEASLVSQAFEGYAFTVDHHRSEDQPEWCYVRMSNGLYGWIPDSEIMVL